MTVDREQIRRDAERQAQGMAMFDAEQVIALLAELEQAERIRAEYDRELEARTAALEQAERERDEALAAAGSVVRGADEAVTYVRGLLAAAERERDFNAEERDELLRRVGVLADGVLRMERREAALVEALRAHPCSTGCMEVGICTANGNTCGRCRALAAYEASRA